MVFLQAPAVTRGFLLFFVAPHSTPCSRRGLVKTPVANGQYAFIPSATKHPDEERTRSQHEGIVPYSNIACFRPSSTNADEASSDTKHSSPVSHRPSALSSLPPAKRRRLKPQYERDWNAPPRREQTIPCIGRPSGWPHRRHGERAHPESPRPPSFLPSPDFPEARQGDRRSRRACDGGPPIRVHRQATKFRRSST